MKYFLLTLVLLGALQGFISSGLLMLRQQAKLPEKLLALLILVVAFANLNIFLWYQQLSSFWASVGEVLPLILFMAIGPLLFLYVRTSLKKESRLTNKDGLHFIPVLFDLLPYMIAGLYHLGVFNKNPFIFIDHYNTYVDVPRWISLTVYCVLSWKLVDNQKTITTIKRVLLPFMIFQIIWLVFISIYIIPAYQLKLIRSVGWFPLYVPLSVLIYWIGFTGFISIKSPFMQGKSVNNSNTLTDDRVEEAIRLLRQAMEQDQLYLNPALNLNLVVNHSGLSQKVISTVLNQYMNMSFNDFVNLYRVEAFKQKIKDPNMQRFTIKGIASDCGFSSLATFQRVFKQMTGQLPSDFRNEEVNRIGK